MRYIHNDDEYEDEYFKVNDNKVNWQENINDKW